MNIGDSERSVYDIAEAHDTTTDRLNLRGLELSFSAESVREMGMIAVQGFENFDDVRFIRSAIDSVSMSSSHIGLDFAELTGQVNGSTVGRLGPIVTNLLLKDELQTRPFWVSPSLGNASASQLARSGLYFALAHHDAGLDIDPNVPADFGNKLDKWKYDWRSVAPREALFSIDSMTDGAESRQFENNVVAFINPSFTPVDIASRQNAIYPWLRQITEDTPKQFDHERRNMLREISIITTELLDNVRNHAKASKSVMILSRVEGSQPCLQIAVIDNGCGIAESLQLQGESMESVDYLQRLVTDTHQLRAMGRGDGLARVSRRTKKCGGSLLVASGPEAKQADSVVLDYDFANRSDGEIRIDDLGLEGTVTVVRIPLDATRYRYISPNS